MKTENLTIEQKTALIEALSRAMQATRDGYLEYLSDDKKEPFANEIYVNSEIELMKLINSI